MNAAARKIFILSVVFAVAALAQPDPDGEVGGTFEFLPAGLHFAPLRANRQEARVGVFKYFGTSNLKVDIGNTIDVFGLSYSSSGTRFTAGIDFFAYAYVTGAQGLRLQVDALDGFFGGNLSFSLQGESGLLQGRLRFLHLSAHLVDGHYSLSQKQWLDNREPIPFTKDFGEIVAAHQPRVSPSYLRYYGGLSYATLVRPAGLQRYGFLTGMELALGDLAGHLFGQPVLPYVADHFSLAGHPAYTGSNQVQLGVKFGQWDKKGVSLYVSYYAGNNQFSEYFDERVSIIGAGFSVDFP